MELGGDLLVDLLAFCMTLSKSVCVHFLICKMGSFQLLVKINWDNAVSGILSILRNDFNSALPALDRDRTFGVLEIDVFFLSAWLLPPNDSGRFR